jgi:hypothetical protein
MSTIPQKQFTKASKKQAKLRMCIAGLSGAGKTYTALKIATELGRVAVIDTERGSASKYASEFAFDVLELDSCSPAEYISAILAAFNAGVYDVLVIDSLSHAWAGKDGALEQVDSAKSRSTSGNSFAAWKDVTPLWNRLLDVITRVPLHVIGTMRQKTEYVMETNERGKTAPKKVGHAPIFREGGEYEFDIVAVMDREHNFIIEKSRCIPLQDKVFHKPEGQEIAGTLLHWLSEGEATVKVNTETGEVIEPAKQQQSAVQQHTLQQGMERKEETPAPRVKPQPAPAVIPGRVREVQQLMTDHGYSANDVREYAKAVLGFEITTTGGFLKMNLQQYMRLVDAMRNSTLIEEIVMEEERLGAGQI